MNYRLRHLLRPAAEPSVVLQKPCALCTCPRPSSSSKHELLKFQDSVRHLKAAFLAIHSKKCIFYINNRTLKTRKIAKTERSKVIVSKSSSSSTKRSKVTLSTPSGTSCLLMLKRPKRRPPTWDALIIANLKKSWT